MTSSAQAKAREAARARAQADAAQRQVTLTYSTGTIKTVTPLTITDNTGSISKAIDMLAGHHTYAIGATVGILRLPYGRPLIFPII